MKIEYFTEKQSNFILCLICGMRIANQKGMEKHMKAHDKKRFVFECAACFKKYATPYRITTHCKRDHPGEQIIYKATQLYIDEVTEVKPEVTQDPMKKQPTEQLKIEPGNVKYQLHSKGESTPYPSKKIKKETKEEPNQSVLLDVSSAPNPKKRKTPVKIAQGKKRVQFEDLLQQPGTSKAAIKKEEDSQDKEPGPSNTPLDLSVKKSEDWKHDLDISDSDSDSDLESYVLRDQQEKEWIEAAKEVDNIILNNEMEKPRINITEQNIGCFFAWLSMISRARPIIPELD